MPYDIINAFTGKESLGNPAAVYILTHQLPKEQLQKIASEIALPETSFIYKNVEEEWEIQWFSPKREVLLCGNGLVTARKAVRTPPWTKNNGMTPVTFVRRSTNVLKKSGTKKMSLLTRAISVSKVQTSMPTGSLTPCAAWIAALAAR